VKWCMTLMQLILACLAVACTGSDGLTSQGTHTTTPTEGLNKVNHIIIVMQENHSFDNYFGVLAYVPGGPYHSSSVGCAVDDHRCVDGLSCSVHSVGSVVCTNSNLDDDGIAVTAFHNRSRCVMPSNLENDWVQSHQEANFNDPDGTLFSAPNDGFVRVSDSRDQPPNGIETAADDPTMGFYTQDDLPFYYDLAKKFAIDDRYFASVMGATLPNRLYLMAATSFGHISGGDPLPAPPDVYKPISGTIFDLLDSKGISWTDYSEGGPQARVFRRPTSSANDPHFQSVQVFLAIAAGSPGAAQLPRVSLIDAPDEEHPPADIQRGQASVSRIVNSVRNGPYWKDSVIFITYDEHGGFYDHVIPPRAPQGSARTPDGISPGQCEDLSNPPANRQPGASVGCGWSAYEAKSLCPALAQSPTAQYPDSCPSFDQLGFRVPLIAVSPFAKPHYVSHTIADHTSLLAFIERRFLSDHASVGDRNRIHLTLRDQYADALKDLFDFENAPSMNSSLIEAAPPVEDCTPPGFY
jgi:phospholipase C